MAYCTDITSGYAWLLKANLYLCIFLYVILFYS